MSDTPFQPSARDVEALRAGVALLPVLQETKDWLPRNSEAVAKITPEELDTIIAALEAARRQLEAPDPLGEALNSGDGVYRP